MDWLREFNWTIEKFESTTTTIDQSEKDKMCTNFEKPFKTNRTIIDSETKKQLTEAGTSTDTESQTYTVPFTKLCRKRKDPIQSGHSEKRENVKRTVSFLR